MAQCGGGPGPARLSILACAEEPVTILGRLPAAVASKEGREGAWGEGGPPRDSWAKASSDQRLSCSLAWSPFFFLILVFPSGKPVDCFLRFLPLPTQACFLPCGGYPSPGPQEPPGAPLGPCPWLFPQRGPQVPSALALSSHPGQAHVCPVPHRGVTLPHPRVTRRPRQAQLCACRTASARSWHAPTSGDLASKGHSHFRVKSSRQASVFSLTFVAESDEGCRNLGPSFLWGLSLAQPSQRENQD